MRGRKKAIIKDQVYLDTSAGLKRALLHLRDLGKDVLSSYQQKRVKQFLKEYNVNSHDYTRAQKNDLNKRVQRWLGIKKSGSISKSRKQPIDFRIHNGRWTALVNTNTAKTKNAIPMRGIGDLMYNWNHIKPILKEFSIMDYENDFYTGLYLGWIKNLAARLNITGIDNMEILDWVYALLHWWDYEYSLYGDAERWIEAQVAMNGLITKQDIDSIGFDSYDDKIRLLELAFKRQWGGK